VEKGLQQYLSSHDIPQSKQIAYIQHLLCEDGNDHILKMAKYRCRAHCPELSGNPEFLLYGLIF